MRRTVSLWGVSIAELGLRFIWEIGMAMRIHEIHPSVVHFPLALAPLSLLLDLAGRIAGRRGWMRAGGRLMPVAAASGAVAAAAGLVAQGSVEVSREAHDTLVTHRNLNLGLVALTGVLAMARQRSETPSLGYLLAGLAGVAAMNYTAYLGGKLVYQYGVGVEKAGGVQPHRSPELRWVSAKEALAAAAANSKQAFEQSIEQAREGELAPALRDSSRA
jgi:uncharacterized membrane protein